MIVICALLVYNLFEKKNSFYFELKTKMWYLLYYITVNNKVIKYELGILNIIDYDIMLI